MCGKPNPEHLEECQFCQARLKPLVLGREEHPEETPGAESGDWLGELQDESAQDAIEFVPDEEFPEWLDEQPEEEVFDARRPTQTGSLRDPLSWLDEMQSAVEETMPRPEQAAPDDQIAHVTDWLAALKGEDGEAESAAEPAAESADLPDWLSGEEESAAEPAAESADLPEWLSGGEESAAEPAAESADLPDWLSGGDESAAEPAAESAELPDWLSGGEESAAEPAAESADLPGWWSGEAESAAEPAAESADLPDWLSGGEESAAEAPAERLVHADTSSLPDMDIPDWLTGETAESLPAAEGTEDWLGDLRAEEPAGADVPDWLSASGEADGQPAAADETEDWLGDLRAEEPAAQETPDWLSDVEQAAEAEETVSPFMLDDGVDVDLGDLEAAETPDWLADVAEVPPEEQPPAESEAPAEALERSDLPGWLQAMKPLDAVSSPQLLPEDEQAPPVSAGPLAGLRGVLPVGAQAVRIGRVSAPSAKLEISEGQEADIGLLRSLLDSEEQPLEAASPAPITSQRLLRWLIALVLFLAVAWPLFTGAQGDLLPDVPPAAVQAVFRQVEQVPSGAPVLLAFEYQPAFGGELDVALRPVVEHLMLRGATLITLSTNPEGALMAEHALRVPAAQRGYTAGEQYLHLGFVPGGAAGLAALAERTRMAVPQTLGGFPAWEQPPLQAVQSLDDFALIVVLADDPAVARLWVEQVARRRPDVPFVLVVSAQAAPLLEPYYQSGQVDGLLAGVMGGAAYERQTGIQGLAQRYGGAFSQGVLVAVALIMLGSVLQLGLTLYQSQNARKEGVAR